MDLAYSLGNAYMFIIWGYYHTNEKKERITNTTILFLYYYIKQRELGTQLPQRRILLFLMDVKVEVNSFTPIRLLI